MNIIIPVKQVPETGNVKMDEKTGTVVREESASIINPLDLYAVETRIQLKEKLGGKITVIRKYQIIQGNRFYSRTYNAYTAQAQTPYPVLRAVFQQNNV